jgi:hypothetical protein
MSAVLRLQRSAGNRAVAGMVTSASSRRLIQRARVLRNGQILDVPDGQEQVGDRIVIRFSACSVRVQNPNDTSRGGNPLNPNASKVSETDFHHTMEGVDATIGDYNNAQGGNLKLWNSGESSLWYAGILRDRAVRMVPQENLNDPDAWFTIILPGAAVEHVSPSASGPANTPYGFVGAYGLSGTITPADRLWTTVRFVVDSLLNATVEGLNRRGFMEFRLLNGKRIVLDLMH